MISTHDRAIYRHVRTAHEAAAFILDFYRTYHSLRYMGDQLVLRLQHPLPEGADAQLTQEFKDIIVTGEIKQGIALTEEADEPQLSQLPRLVFQFNRKDYGRLQELIYRINELGNSATSDKRQATRKRQGTSNNKR
jgi:hypothetical protein